MKREISLICNFQIKHDIQPISKLLLTAIKPIYSSFPIPCSEIEKSWAKANLFLTESKASPCQILTTRFERTEFYIS